MCQWFSHFCRRCWVNSVPHPPSSLRGSHSGFPCPYCWLIGGQNVVVQFLRGARIMNPLRPRTVPPWDLPTILRALKRPPFEPLQSSSLRALSLKATLLLALASVKRVGDQVFSPSTFVRFYNLDVPVLQARVLTA